MRAKILIWDTQGMGDRYEHGQWYQQGSQSWGWRPRVPPQDPRVRWHGLDVAVVAVHEAHSILLVPVLLTTLLHTITILLTINNLIAALGGLRWSQNWESG